MAKDPMWIVSIYGATKLVHQDQLRAPTDGEAMRLVCQRQFGKSPERLSEEGYHICPMPVAESVWRRRDSCQAVFPFAEA